MIFTVFSPILLTSMGSGVSHACDSAEDRAAASSVAPNAKDRSTADCIDRQLKSHIGWR